ncbi:unnamed protein product [Orchesella dallaii]|uniref:Cytoplasmic envelopment protein 3 n=1 Tax=Orchesella dallaii TaxID=48710 RepID=A0ABP1RRL7_9HEXA
MGGACSKCCSCEFKFFKGAKGFGGIVCFTKGDTISINLEPQEPKPPKMKLAEILNIDLTDLTLKNYVNDSDEEDVDDDVESEPDLEFQKLIDTYNPFPNKKKVL